MPCILHIETSTKVCSVALSEDGKLLYHHEDYDGPSHSETSGVYVDEALSYLESHDFCNPHQLIRNEWSMKLRKEFFKEYLSQCSVYMVNTTGQAKETQERIREIVRGI